MCKPLIWSAVNSGHGLRGSASSPVTLMTVDVKGGPDRGAGMTEASISQFLKTSLRVGEFWLRSGVSVSAGRCLPS